MTPSFATRAVHAGRHDFTDLGVHAPPLDLSSTYPTPDLAAAAWEAIWWSSWVDLESVIDRKSVV